MVSDRSFRSFAPLSSNDLRRLAALADTQHAQFTRQRSRQHSWADRRVAVTLAQGGAKHYLDGTTGLKDFDVWTFYAAIPGTPLKCGRYETHADFGPSIHGRQLYPPDFEHRQAAAFLAYKGRRVDFLVRDLPVDANVTPAEVTGALRAWLRRGSAARADKNGKHPTPWHLSQKAMIWIAGETPGTVIWPTSDSDSVSAS